MLHPQARLRLNKKQRDALAEQTAEARRQVAELRAERSALATRLQVPALLVHLILYHFPPAALLDTTLCWLLVRTVGMHCSVIRSLSPPRDAYQWRQEMRTAVFSANYRVWFAGKSVSAALQ